METRTLITRAYAAFNRRDIDGVFELMADDVSWPKASEGGQVTGKDAIRDYWIRQWSQFDPHVEPIEIVDRSDGRTGVRVHQTVKSLGGDVLFDGEVSHIYTVANGRILRMDLEEGDAGSASTPSAAFAKD